MKRIMAILTLIATLFSTGCHSDQPRPREIIILPDLSASIDKDSQQQMFAAIRNLALHLRRGDNLTIIPITGSADADLSGKILRYEIPPAEKREAYDGDLGKISIQISKDLSRLSFEAAIHPGAHTDILGTVLVALRAFSNESADKHLIVLSDFIQDDNQFNFATDRQLESEDSATTLAYALGRDITIPASVKVTLGRLQSEEFGRLSAKRQLAVNAFWKQLIQQPTVCPDGLLAVQITGKL